MIPVSLKGSLHCLGARKEEKANGDCPQLLFNLPGQEVPKALDAGRSKVMAMETLLVSMLSRCLVSL